MKRFLIFLTLFVVLFMCLISCGETEHVHEFGDWSPRKNATCTEDGFKIRYCSCGEIQSDLIVSIGHNYVYGECINCGDVKEVSECNHNNFTVLVAVDSTCTKTGLTEGKQCKECGEMLVAQEIVSIKGHIYTPVVTEPTCVDMGYTTYICDCGDISYIGNYTSANVSFHSFEEWYPVYGPWCEEEGLERANCIYCDENTSRIVPPLGGHIWTIVITEPTCTENGYTTNICTRDGCGYYFTYDEVDPHTPGKWVIAQEPTLTKEGLMESICECGKKTTRSCGYHSDYYYTVLALMPNGEKMQILYNEIDKIAVEFHSNANWNAVDGLVAKINYTDIGLNWDEASSVYHIYRYDHPLYYWFSSTVHTNGTDLIVCAADEYSQGTERAVYNQMVYDSIKSYTEQIAQNETSKYQIALGCHDKVIHSIEYAYEPCTMPPLPEDDIWAHNILGVFEMHSGVCESYALTFQLLLNYCGVEGTVVLGYSEEEAHAWNIAKMDDGNWYWFDLTFDDSAYDISYFCLNDIQKIYTNYDDSYTDLNFMDVHTLNSPDNCFGKISSTLPDRNNDVTMNNNGPIDYYSANGWGSWWITSDTGIFKIVGYNAVQFVSTNSSVQNLVIPEKVTFKGRTYDVVSINTRNGGFRSETISSVTIPKSVRLIIEFNAKNLEEIIVDENNPYYTSQDGVLFTKSLYTLIAYPCANTRSSYVVPNEVRHIQDFAFGSIGDACKYLLELTLKNDIIVGVLHWGLPQDDEDWCGTGIHTISIDFQYKVRLAEMLKKGGEVIWIY